MSPAAPSDYRQHLEVETPEHVVLDYEIAGLGSRALAAILDTLILAAWTLAIGLVISLASIRFPNWGSAIFGLIYFASIWGYFAFFEGLRRGQTPGKRRLGIRVVRDTGHALTFGAAAARNLLRAADFLPPPYLLGGILVALHPRGKRLGDLVAGTVVVRDQPIEKIVPIARDTTGRTDPADEAGAPELTDDEFKILRQFNQRAASLDAKIRDRLAERLATRFAEGHPNRPELASEFLVQLYRDEMARRRSRFGGRSAVRDAPAGEARSGVAERMVARKEERWIGFQRLAERAAQDGLDSFAALELPDFAARYREVAADLARARTYRAPAAVQQRLERLVAAGHNALYRDERKTLPRIWEVLIRECPGAIYQARRYVLLAFLTFMAPAAAGYFLIRERPTLAQELLPDVMLERAEAGKQRLKEGKGYVQVGATTRPVVASQIITNNIGVAFYCFASGIFGGVGSLVMLAYNGLAIGAASGHFANVGLLGYLWTFIVGHGVLELFAIWVAGGAGFMLGRALIAPGDLPRGEALVIHGRVAVRMIGAVVVLLLVAGTIEGFVSAGAGQLRFRLAVSAASALFLLLYLGNGALWASQQARKAEVRTEDRS